MGSLIDRLRAYIGSDQERYEVDEYVLERREPDPDPRVTAYDESVAPERVMDEESLPSGTYILQEVKPSGMAGETVWEHDLIFDEGETE